MIQSMQCLGITDLFSFSKPPSAVKFLVPGVSTVLVSSRGVLDCVFDLLNRFLSVRWIQSIA